MSMALTRQLGLVKGCNLKKKLGLMGLMILWTVRVGEWLVSEGAIIVVEV